MGTGQFNLMLGVTLQLTCISSRGGGGVEKLLVVHATETGDKRLPGGPLGSYAHFTFNLFKACHTILKM